MRKKKFIIDPSVEKTKVGIIVYEHRHGERYGEIGTVKSFWLEQTSKWSLSVKFLIQSYNSERYAAKRWPLLSAGNRSKIRSDTAWIH